jgi:hypothetical protein
MKRYFLFFLIVIAVTSCSKKDPAPASPGATSGGGPALVPPGPAEIISIDAITSDRADVTFTVASAPTMTESGVCWGTEPQPAVLTDPANLFVHNNSGHTFSSSATGLKRETKYYIRAYARSVNGTVMGKVHSFTTPFPGLNEGAPWEPYTYEQLGNAYLSTDSNVVFAAYFNQWNSMVMGLSNNEGKNWELYQYYMVKGTRLSGVFVAGDSYQVLTDSGVFTSWSRWGNVIAFKNKDVRTIGGNRQVMLACTATQLFKLGYLDSEFKSIPVQFPSDSINAVIMRGNDIYLGTNTGIYKGTPENLGWKKVSNEPTVKLFSIKTGILSYTRSGGIIRSSDGGVSWVSASSLSNVIQVCGAGPNLFAVCKNSPDVFVSKSGGPWSKFGSSFSENALSIAITHDHLLVSTSTNTYRKRLY